MEIKSALQRSASEGFEFVQGIRRHIHMHPELSFQEEKTAAYIAEQLKSIGIPFRTGIAGPGIVAEIAGNEPGAGLVALRADMDALPII